MKISGFAFAIALLCSAGTSAQEISEYLRASLPAYRPYIAAKNPVKDRIGFKLYRINLNPFVVEELRRSPEGLDMEERIEVEVQRDLAEMEKQAADGDGTRVVSKPLSYQNSGVVIAAQSIERKYNIKIQRAYSSLDFLIDLYADPETIQKIRNDESVVSIREVDVRELGINVPILQGKTSQSKSSSHDVVLPGGEYISWARAFVQGSSTANSSNPVYVVDGGRQFRLSNGQIVDGWSYVPAENYNIPMHVNLQTSYPNDGYPGQHGLAVTSVINAGQNGYGTVGMNPGQPIYYYGSDEIAPSESMDPTGTGHHHTFNEAFSHAEASRTFPVINLSLNGFLHDGEDYDALNPAGKAFRQASNRFLVVQSAGNHNRDACEDAYNYGKSFKPNDGILVVGGLNRASQPWVDSSFGPCVDVWAPADEISTTTYKHTEYTSIVNPLPRWIASGTSFAAPITAAVASRIGSNSVTRPLIREWALRAGAQDATLKGHASKIVKWPAAALSQVPELLPYTVTMASANAGDTYLLSDGRYNNGHWSPQSGNGYVAVKLATNRNIYGVRFTLRTSDATGTKSTSPGQFHVSVFRKVGASWVNEVHVVETKQANNVPIHVPLNYINTQEIMVWGSNDTSWFAMSELEIYGK